LRTAALDLGPDVAADELARRLAEGLTDFAEFTRLAAELATGSAVVDRVDGRYPRARALHRGCPAAE
jgi:hypothetical protein